MHLEKQDSVRPDVTDSRDAVFVHLIMHASILT